MSRTSPREIAIVPHTHWDREWYEPYQTFRMNLVDLVDGLLPLLETDPSYQRFLLDGQMAVVDDYLEVRPEHEARLRALAGSGRVTVGPWYILLDEFLVSPETIVRDLQMGLARGASFGGAMDIGYLPDMFGHVAQMPQILRLAGFEHAVVWRGVPSSITKTWFWWEAPDGSSVRAEYLPVGYGNGASLPDDAKALVRRMADHEQEVASFLIDGILYMNGSDHLRPQPFLGRVVAEADGLERHVGELRSGARANVLMGVTSNRVDVRRAEGVATREIEGRAEPYAALFMPASAYPSRLLELAWTSVVRNSAHDSVCACSVDDVVDAVLHRYAEARQIGEGVAQRALSSLGRSMASSGPVVVNPSARRRSGVVELVVSAEGALGVGEQLVSERTGLPGSMTLDADTVRVVLSMLQGPRIDNDAWVHDVRVVETAEGLDVTVVVGVEERPNVPIGEAKQDIYTYLGGHPDAMVRISLDQPPIRRIAARVVDVDGFGWRSFEGEPLSHPATATATASEGADSGAVTLANGLVTVVVDPTDGTFSIDGVAGFGRLVDGGDLGDSYNYSPPGQDSFVDTPESVTVAVGDRGPVRSSAVITSTYLWPDKVEGSSQRRIGEQRVTVSTVVEVRAEEQVVRVTTTFTNPARDHRLRVHLPLPSPAATSVAECAFGTVERGLTAEGRTDEFGLPTFPARRFVQAGGLTVVHEGVREYELVDISEGADGATRASTLALCLLRSTGMLSRLGMRYRPFPAGPMTAVDGLQLAGRQIEARYALAMGDVDPWALADDVLLPLEVVTAGGGGDRPASGQALSVEGAEVSAVHRVAGALEVRVHNPSETEAVVRFGTLSGWLVDLRGRPLEPFNGSFSLRPHGIATVRLAGA